MDRELLKFQVPSFQSSIMTIYCSLCHKLWADRYENPTCVCDEYWLTEPQVSMAVLNLDLHILSMFYDGELSRSRFWIGQFMPYYAFLMEVSPSWIDFP